MPAISFTEAFSTDPVERAIAARVVDILSKLHLTAVQRRTQVQRAQGELIEHQRQRGAPAKVTTAKRRKRGPVVDPLAARRRELGRPPAATTPVSTVRIWGVGVPPGGGPTRHDPHPPSRDMPHTRNQILKLFVSKW